MRRVMTVFAVAVIGAVLGALLSAYVLRPTDGELETAARGLVPADFTVTSFAVMRRGWLPYQSGWMVAFAHRPERYAPGTVASASTARARGWKVDDLEQFPDGDEVRVSGLFVEGYITSRGDGDGGTQVEVGLHRTYVLAVATLPALLGLLLGAAGVLVVGRVRRARADARDDTTRTEPPTQV